MKADEEKVEELVWRARVHLNGLKEVFTKLYRMRRLNDFMLGKVDLALYVLHEVLSEAGEGELEVPPVPSLSTPGTQLRTSFRFWECTAWRGLLGRGPSARSGSVRK